MESTPPEQSGRGGYLKRSFFSDGAFIWDNLSPDTSPSQIIRLPKTCKKTYHSGRLLVTETFNLPSGIRLSSEVVFNPVFGIL